MKPLKEIYADYEEILGRKLTDDEKDHCWICQRTGSWGFGDTIGANGYASWDQVKWRSDIHGSQCKQLLNSPIWKDKHGDRRYIAKVGNPVSWQLVSEEIANRYIGIILVPERHDPDGKICCVQFRGKQIYRIWITIKQAERVIRKLVQGKSLLNAVEQCLSVPLSALEKELLKKIVNN